MHVVSVSEESLKIIEILGQFSNSWIWIGRMQQTQTERSREGGAPEWMERYRQEVGGLENDPCDDDETVNHPMWTSDDK